MSYNGQKLCISNSDVRMPFCGWQSSMAEWVFEETRKTELSPGEPVTENVYAAIPKLSEDKSYVIIKKKYTYDDSEYVRITASQIFFV